MSGNKYANRPFKLSGSILSLNSRLPKGSKYYGETVEWACYNHPEYILECHEKSLYFIEQFAINLAKRIKEEL